MLSYQTPRRSRKSTLPKPNPEQQHPLEKLAADSICGAAKAGWKVTKWLAPKVGRIFARVAVRGAEAAASTQTAKKVVEVVTAVGEAREKLRKSSQITPGAVVFGLLVMIGFSIYVTHDDSGSDSSSGLAPASVTAPSVAPTALSTPVESAQPEETQPAVATAVTDIATPTQAAEAFAPPTPTAPQFSVRKGSRVWLHEGTTLYHEDSVYRQTESTEAFKVLQYLPEKRRLYLLSKDSKGKPITVNVPEAAVFSIER